MRTPRIPSDLLDPVVEFFKPQRVILFGSRARGEATRDSDIDLLVVVDDDTPAEKLHWQEGFAAYRSKRDARISDACRGFRAQPCRRQHPRRRSRRRRDRRLWLAERIVHESA